MDSRLPKMKPSGTRLPPVSTNRGTTVALGPLVKSKLTEDPLWGYFAMNGKWICPYCLSVVNRRAGRSRDDSITMHMESCRGFGNGHGQVQLVEVIARRQQYENLVHLADSDPSWRVYDASGTWYCPACLDRILAVRIQGTQLTSFVYQAMADHLSNCGSYLRGVRPRPEDVQRARDHAARFPALLQALQHNLQFSAWRYLDSNGLWVCPCCLKHVPRVRVISDADWSRAPEQITHHLLQECTAYANDPSQVQPEASVREAAAQAVPVLQSAQPTYRAPVPANDSTSANRTPLSGLTVPVARPATITPIVNVARTPPIARPALGRQSQTPSQINITYGTPIVNRRTDTTPQGAPQIPHFVPPQIAQPITPPPSSATIPTGKSLNNGPLFGDLPTNVLDGTSLDLPSEDSINSMSRSDDHSSSSNDDGSKHSSDDGNHELGWMDHAETHAPTTHQEKSSAERTDMIKARAVQAGLMQKPPEVAGFHFAACYEACTDISGDFYQYIRLPDGRVGFAMGDVSGHGVQAGLIMSMAKKTFEIYASMGLSPAETLSRVNDAIARDLGGKLFVSMVYALLDPTTRTITWARAGHTPSLRYNADDDKVEEIKPPGMVVGMKTGPMFRNSIQEQVTTVRSGDVILLYTDGITETMNLQQEEFGTERLVEVMRRFGSQGAEALVTRIMEIIRHFRGPQPPADDSTLLVLTVD